jgi:hypothetical protein
MTSSVFGVEYIPEGILVSSVLRHRTENLRIVECFCIDVYLHASEEFALAPYASSKGLGVLSNFDTPMVSDGFRLDAKRTGCLNS